MIEAKQLCEIVLQSLSTNLAKYTHVSHAVYRLNDYAIVDLARNVTQAVILALPVQPEHGT
jgi:hypothetical protein